MAEQTGTPKKSNANSMLGKAGLGLEMFADISTGINALSTAKYNAGLKREQGQEAFKTILGDLHQAVGAYQAEQGASGISSQSARDVKMAGISTGIKSAATAKYNARIEANNIEALGRSEKNKAIMGAGQSLLASWGNK